MNRALFLLTASLIPGAIAGAQPREMNVTIPFAFETIHGASAAGAYRIHFLRMANDTRIVSLSNAANNRTLYLVGFFSSYEKGAPSLTFRCAAVGCALTSIRNEQGTTTYTHRLSRHQVTAERNVTIRPGL